MTTGGQELERLLTDLRGHLDAVAWTGPDAEQFRTRAHTDPEFLAEHVRRMGPERYEVDLLLDGEWTKVEVSGVVQRDGVRGPDGDQNWATLYEQALIEADVLGDDGTQIVEQHAYTVEIVNPDGTMTLVDPWGSDCNDGAEDGSHRITITEEDYRRSFDGVAMGSSPDGWDR